MILKEFGIKTVEMKQIEIIVSMIKEEKIQMLPVLGFQPPNIP